MNSKLLGSILIIAGSSIGAGMLAMPITSAGVGFAGTSLLLLFVWFLMCYTALLMLRVYDFNAPTDGFDTLTKKYTNYAVNRIAGLSLMFLIYGLTAAYMTGGGTILKANLEIYTTLRIDPRVAILLFSLLFSSIVIFGTRSVDVITKGLFSIKLIGLVFLVILLIPVIKSSNLLALPLSKGVIITSIPAIFTSFGFHGSIPSIVNYLDGDKKKLRFAFITGSLIPLGIYLVWQIVVLGSLDQTTFMAILTNNLGLDGLIVSMREIANTPTIESLFSFFAAAALGTSFLGVSIGLFDYYKDVFKKSSTTKRNLLSSISTFVPPLLFALFYPTGFIVALGYAAIAGVILALIIPAILYISAMNYHKQKINSIHYILLTLVFLFSCVVIYAQLLIVN